MKVTQHGGKFWRLMQYQVHSELSFYRGVYRILNRCGAARRARKTFPGTTPIFLGTAPTFQIRCGAKKNRCGAMKKYVSNLGKQGYFSNTNALYIKKGPLIRAFSEQLGGGAPGLSGGGRQTILGCLILRLWCRVTYISCSYWNSLACIQYCTH